MLGRFSFALDCSQAPGAASGGGVIDSTVEELGWNLDIIAVTRRPLFSSHSARWTVIHARTSKMTSPLSDSEKSILAGAGSIPTESTQSAWNRL